MQQINFQEILHRLAINYQGPSDALPWGYIIYTMMFLYVVTLFLQKKSNLTITLLMGAALLCALLDKVAIGQISGFQKGQFGAFFIRIIMFTVPLVVAGMTKWGKSRGPGILAGIIGAVYLLGRWYVDQMPR